MTTIIAVFTLGFAVVLQTSIIINIKLLFGSADLVLLTLLAWILNEKTEGHWQWGLIAGIFVGIFSELPIWISVLGFLLVVLVVQFLFSKIWQAPLVILFVSIIVGSLITMSVNYIYMVIIGIPLPLSESLNLIILPSLILNLLLILPTYALIGEIAKAVYPTGSN